ncbi:hypothetical protein ACTQ45_09410 [Fundicoccus sp. Sow4_D5]
MRNIPENPSPTGTVTRGVKGVTIHEQNNGCKTNGPVGIDFS